VGNCKGVALSFLGGACCALGDSCGHLARRDATEAGDDEAISQNLALSVRVCEGLVCGDVHAQPDDAARAVQRT
jgi:hypothetical protein